MLENIDLSDELLQVILPVLWKKHKKGWPKNLLEKKSFFEFVQRELMVYAKQYYHLNCEIKKFFDNKNISHRYL